MIAQAQRTNPNESAPLSALFPEVTLGQLGRVRLMNRVDTKFLLSPAKLSDLLPALSPNYLALEIEGERNLRYETHYFDTDKLSMYVSHHNGERERFKIRRRQYLCTGACFLEIKRKDNKGRTRKKRLPIDALFGSLSPAEQEFIRLYSPFSPNSLALKLINRFSRLTLVDSEFSERVTVDSGVTWRQPLTDLAASNSPAELEWFSAAKPYHIVEVKRAGAGSASRALRHLQHGFVPPSAFSKYCIGAAFLLPGLRTNLFKATLMRVSGSPLSASSSRP